SSCANRWRVRSTALRNAEYMSVGMAVMQFTNVPRHVSRWPGDFYCLVQALLVNRVDIFHPDRHPHASVCCLLAVRAESSFQGTLASAALAVFTKKDFAIARIDPAEGRRLAPVPL